MTTRGALAVLPVGLVLDSLARGRQLGLMRHCLFVFVGLVVATSTLYAQSRPASLRPLGPRHVDTLPLRTAGERLAYGPDSLHFGELRLPDAPTTRVPLAIVIHGGCFQARYATLRNAAPLADALSQAGVASWNIEYRRVDSPGGGWPGSFLDIAHAVDHVRALAQRYPIDTTRVVVAGHSAGGFFAIWAASRRGLSPRSPLATGAPLTLRGAVSIGGIVDLGEFRRSTDDPCSRGVDGLLGGFPDAMPTRLAEADPMQRLPFGIPTVHIAGSSDPFGTLARREALATAARRAGDHAEVITVDGGHFEVMAPHTAPGRATVDAILSLLGLPRPAR